MWVLQIFYKEFLSLRPLIVVGVLGMAQAVISDIGATYGELTVAQSEGTIPFLRSTINLTWVPMLLALAIGFYQTWIESFRDTWLFLLHRPVDRLRILIAKGVSGMLLIWILTIASGMILATWAATPGMMPAPFKWSFTTSYFWSCALLIIPYLGGFLTGLHAGSWWMTKPLPAIASLAGYSFLQMPQHVLYSYSPMMAVAGIAVLLMAIRHEVRDCELA